MGSNETDASQWHLRQWLSDTPIYLDALEIIAEKSRTLWWGQQLDLATLSWTTLLAIEGRRRNIPHLWAYALLAHLVSLSFAQNLFYVALLLTPSPIPTQKPSFLDRFFSPKPNNWIPNPSVVYSFLALSSAVALWLPWTAGSSWFPIAATLAKLLSFAPLILNTIAPQSWGTTHLGPHSSYRVITNTFQAISAASALLHAKTTVSSLFYNFPGPRKHRHSIKIPFDTQRRSKWERSATSIEKVLGSINDHPAVNAAGKDVLLCALSLGLWAAVRAVDVGNMLRSAMPLYKSTEPSPPDVSTSVHEVDAPSEKQVLDRGNGTSMNLRSRGRRTKGETDNNSIDGNLQTSKRRGRPRRSKVELEASPDLDQRSEMGESAYKPTPVEKEDIDLGDVVPDDDFDWESASLAWGLSILGGLGAGAAAVYGGECISR